jgi:hypothetical protein
VEIEVVAESELIRKIGTGRGAEQRDEAVRIVEGQRSQEHRVDDAEHPGHCTDREGESADRRDEKARRAKQGPPRMAKVRRPLSDHFFASPRSLGFDSSQEQEGYFRVRLQSATGFRAGRPPVQVGR